MKKHYNFWGEVSAAFAVVALLLIIFSAIGCNTEKRARAFYVEHPEKLARECADKFPPTFKGGDTVRIAGDSAAYLAAIDELVQSLSAVNEINDSLLAEVLKDPDCIKYSETIARLQRENRKLKDKPAAIPCPKDVLKITDTVENFARVKALVFDLAALETKLGASKDELIEAQRKAAATNDDKDKWKKRFFLMLGAVVLFIGGKAVWAYLKAKKPF